MNYSFPLLLTGYAKHLERYFSSVSEQEEDLGDCATSFHEVLIAALTEYGDIMRDSSFTVGDLSGNQICSMVSQLVVAEKEVAAEADLRHKIRRHFFPGYWELLSPNIPSPPVGEVASAIKSTCPSK